MKKILGYLCKGIGKILDYILKAIIWIVDIFVSIFTSVRQLFGYIISMGGCLILLFIFNPFVFWALISNPAILTLVLLSILVPIIGTIAVSYLKYIHYMITEYFYDKADSLLLGRKVSYDNFKGYGAKYKKDLEKERRKRMEEDRKRQEEEWKKRYENGSGGRYYTFGDFEDFEEFFKNMNQGNYGGYQGQYQGNYSGYQSANMGSSFKTQYEKACDVLEVPHNADKYQIKLQYKKMAKKYHPDLNKDPGATAKFQEINSAYSFLSDENVERYKNIG